MISTGTLAMPRLVRRVFGGAVMRKAVVLLGLGALAACDPAAFPSPNLNPAGGPRVDTSRPIPVALLVPRSDSGAGAIARSLENAARLAIADLDGVQIDLRVYDTAGNAGVAGSVAQQAVNDGAQIILGPLFGEAANAAGLAVADDGVNVLAFSNNPSIAGGNVFILGSTFRNTANRLTSYMRRTGRSSMVILHSADVPGQFGRTALQAAASRQGVRVDATIGYDPNQQSLDNAMERTAQVVRSQGSSTVMMTADYDGALPFLLDILPGKGVSPETTTYAGLTRWDTRPDAFQFPGLRNSLFALPDQTNLAGFRARYQEAYGSAPHQLAGLAFDGIAAVGALVERRQGDALTSGAIMQSQGFQGVSGIFRFLPDGTNERGLAVASIQDRQVVVLEPAPSSFAGAGF